MDTFVQVPLDAWMVVAVFYSLHFLLMKVALVPSLAHGVSPNIYKRDA